MPTLISSETKTFNSSDTFTVPTGCTYVLALIARAHGSQPSAVSLGGVSMGAALVTANNTDSRAASAWGQVQSSSGSKTLAITASPSQPHVVTLLYCKEVDTSSPVVGTGSDGGDFTNTFSLNCTSENGALVFDVIAVQTTGTLTQGAGQTLIDDTVLSSMMHAVSQKAATTTSTAMSWSSSGSNQRQAHVAVALRHKADVAPTRRHRPGIVGARPRAYAPPRRNAFASILSGATRTVGDETPLPPDYWTPRNPTVRFPNAAAPAVAFPRAVTPTVRLTL